MLNRKVLLACMAKHETLTIDDIQKAENIGFVPDLLQLSFLLECLTASGDLVQLPGVLPDTYTITTKGIAAAT